MKLRNEEVILKNMYLAKTLSRETSQKKAFCNSNIEKVEILHVLHNKIALEWGNILSGEQEIVTKKVLERFGPYI